MTYLERPPAIPLMIHVAAEHENRGRVVLAAVSGSPHPVAVDAAFALARAFDASVEGLFVACTDVAALTAHSFAREVSHAGRIMPLATGSVADHQAAEIARARRVISAAADRSGVRLTTTVVRDAPAEALTKACALQGPWNIVALAEPVAPAEGSRPPGLLDQIGGATGILCCGPEVTARRAAPVAMILRDIDAAPQMLRAAERLAVARPDPAARQIAVLLAGQTSGESEQLEAHVRLMMPSGQTDGGVPVAIAEAASRHGTPDEIAEAVRRMAPAWLMARAGPPAAPNSEIAALLRVVRCPLLLVR